MLLRKVSIVVVLLVCGTLYITSSLDLSKYLNDVNRVRARTNDTNQLKIVNSASSTTLLSQLETTAIQILTKSEREGLSRPHPPYIHYSVSKFQLSIQRSSSVTFSVHDGINLDQKLDEQAYGSLTDRIICNMDRVNSLNMNHIPHFSQVAFPCWSILQQFPNAKERLVKLRNFDWDQITSQWIHDLMQAFKSSGIQIINYQYDDDKNFNKKYRFAEEEGQNTTSGEKYWIATIDKPKGGFTAKKDDEAKYKIESCRYFLNQMDDIQSLQRQVLGNEYQQLKEQPPDNKDIPLQVLLIDRKGGTREWLFANETKNMIQEVWGADRINVKVVSHLEGSLRDQALELHRADIIISPHGAQLTNLAFIRPCTSVLELFSPYYYLGYFQPLVLSAGGISFDGYPYERVPFLDTDSSILADASSRSKIRSTSIHSSPQSILRAFPKLVMNNISCRRGRWNGLQ